LIVWILLVELSEREPEPFHPPREVLFFHLVIVRLAPPRLSAGRVDVGPQHPAAFPGADSRPSAAHAVQHTAKLGRLFGFKRMEHIRDPEQLFPKVRILGEIRPRVLVDGRRFEGWRRFGSSFLVWGLR